MTLMELLNAVYAAKYLHKGNVDDKVAALKDAIGKDPYLMAAAINRRNDLEALQAYVGAAGKLHDRDVIGAVHLEALKAALDT